MNRTHWVLFWVILGVGLSLRFHALDRQSLWDDEMSTRKSTYLPIAVWPAHFRTYEAHPPLYFLQLKGWEKFFGSTLRSQRANAALWGSIGLVLLFALGRRLYGVGAALAAMALLAVSPYHLAYSQEMRPYAMAITLGLGGFLAVRRGARASLLITIFVAECFTHYWGAFMVVAQVAYGALRTDDRRARMHLGLCGLSAALVFGAWWPILRDQLFYIKDLSFWVAPASPANLAKTAIAFTGLYFNHASTIFHAPGPDVLHVVLGGLMFLLAFLGLRKGSRLPLVWLLVGLGMPYLMSYYRHGLYVWYRYPSLVYPAFILSVAGGLWMIKRPVVRSLILAGFLGMSAWSCFAYKTSWQKANPKDVVSYVQQIAGPDATIIRPAYFAPLFAYYAPNRRRVIDQDKLDSAERRAGLKPGPVVFIAFDVPNDPVRDALLSEFSVKSRRVFPGRSHLGITVYELQATRP